MGNHSSVTKVPVASLIESDNIVSVIGTPYNASAPPIELMDIQKVVISETQLLDLQNLTQKEFIKIIKKHINEGQFDEVIAIVQNCDLSVRNLFNIKRYIENNCLSNSDIVIKQYFKTHNKKSRVNLQHLLIEKIEKKHNCLLNFYADVW